MKKKYFLKLITFIFLISVFGSSCLKSAGKNEHPVSESVDSDSVNDITLVLSKLAIDTKIKEIPDTAFIAAKTAMLDALGCAFGGHEATGVHAVLSLSKDWGGKGESTIWFDGTKVPAPEAAFVNSFMLHALDFDDYHGPSDSHITSVLVPVVLAIGELNNSSGEEILTALVLGTEVVGRLGRAYKARRNTIGFLPSSVIGGFGATAAASRLMGLSVEETVNAMGIWYAQASGNRQALFDHTLTKRMQPAIAARAAINACFMASKGITGPTRIIGKEIASLTQIYGCDPDLKPPTVNEIMTNYESWQIEQLQYKAYACCGYSGRALELASNLSREYNLKPEDIKEIRLFGEGTDSPFAAVPWYDHPTPQVLAQFCMPYAAASAIRNLRYGAAEISPSRIAEDREVDSLARRTRICTDWSEWKGSRPKELFGMEIDLVAGHTLQGTINNHRQYFWPEDYDQLKLKFKRTIDFSGFLDESKGEELISVIENLNECKNIAEFIKKWLVY